MTAPVTTAPSTVRAAAPSASDGDPASGATFASALDGALRPGRDTAPGVAKGRGDLAHGRGPADHGMPAHARPAGRPSPPAREHDGTPGVKPRSRQGEQKAADDAESDQDAATAMAGTPGGSGTPPVAVDAVVAAALAPAVPPPWAPALGLVRADSAAADPAAVDSIGAPGATDGQPEPVATDLVPAVGGTPAQTSPQALDPAALQVLAAAAQSPVAPIVPGAGPAALSTAPAAVVPAGVPAGTAADVAVATSTAAPSPSAAPAATATDDALPAQLPLPATAVGAHALRSPARAVDGATAPAGGEPTVDAAVPATGTAAAGPVAAAAGGSSSADAGNTDRQDQAASAAAPVTTVVGTPPPAPVAPVVAPVAAAAAPPAAPPPVATQLVQHVAVLTNGPDGTHSVTVVLHPDSLGPVQVQVTLSQGTIDLTMRGAHEHGRAALMDALPDLRRDLESAGLTCSNLDVDQGTGGSWSTQHQSAQQQAAQQQWGDGRGQSPGRGENRPQPWLRPVVPADGSPAAGSNRSTSAGVDVRV
ncbi:MAG: flagellar hook-length control protein FliK [Blastococcus sp.]